MLLSLANYLFSYLKGFYSHVSQEHVENIDKENKNTRKLPGDDVNSVIISCLATWFVLCSKGNGMQRKTVHVALT